MSEGNIFQTQDGSHSIFSDKHGVSYHSKYGAIQESRHVFIQAGLYYRMPGMKAISVLEIGFGTGLNAFLTLIEAGKHQLPITYEAIEAYPLSIEQAAQLNYPHLLAKEGYEAQFLELHQLEWGVSHKATPFFTFQKHNQLFEEIRYENAFDLIYFDAFAPNAQPELWEEEVLQLMFNALKENGVLTTYCAKGAVKRSLRNIGFELEALQGPPGKREMTRAVKPREEG